MKRKRKERREKLSMMMHSRETRRHPEKAEQGRMGSMNVNSTYFRAFLANGLQKG